MAKKLTARQQEILDAIAEFIQTNGMPPTTYELADIFDVRVPTVFAHVRALQRKGYLTRTSKARSIVLTGSNKPKHLSMSLSVPLLGKISAGLPLFAEENREDTLTFEPKMLPPGLGGHRLFALHVQGDSMRDKGILDGDTVIVKETDTAELGEVVVALVEGDETTVKSLYLTDDGQVELRPANPRYEPQLYEQDLVRIQGVVVALFRHF